MPLLTRRISQIAGKSGIKFAGPDVEAMRAVAAAYKKRSLDDFTAALSKYSAQLKADPVIFSHLDALYDGLLEQVHALNSRSEYASPSNAFLRISFDFSSHFPAFKSVTLRSSSTWTSL
jgi:hypothetical protein